MKRLLTLILVFLTLTLPCSSFGEGTFLIDDQAGLLTVKQTAQLQEDYAGILTYMDAAFVTTLQEGRTTARYADAYAEAQFGNDPAVLFIIDMHNREIYVYANGSAQRSISRADARAISDNIYTYASRADYYGCADAAFAQIYATLKGEELARPVKHITNALIALLAAILINYCVLLMSRARKRESVIKGDVSVSASRSKDFFRGAAIAGVVAGALLAKRKIYHESSSSGGGGFSGGGGGGGGGGHSGGGGGHRF